MYILRKFQSLCTSHTCAQTNTHVRNSHSAANQCFPLSLNALLYIPERNDLKCIIRSHAEVKSGCGLSHANCYTVFSAPFEEKGIMGGLIELRGDTLNLQAKSL